MELRLLGPIELVVEDGPIELGPRKQRAVLAMLALEVGRTVSADRLAEGLWAEHRPSSAAKMVQLYVSHLRRLLDGNGGRILTRGRGYELQVADGGVDVLRVERLLEQFRAREALALWRGEPLADVADEPFAAAEIRRLDELRLHAAEMAIDADLEAGRHAEVIGELDELVATYPLRERLHAQRMLALYRSGRQAEALEAYRIARATLVEEIGVEPGAELRRLQAAILAQDPALDPPRGTTPMPETVPPRRPPRRRLAVAAALLLAGLTAFGVVRLAEPDGLAGISENAVGVIDPDGGRITAEYAVGRSPSAVAAGGGSVWVANALDGTVTRADPQGASAVTIPVGGAPSAVAFGGGSLWVADGDTHEVLQVDSGANKVLQRFEVGNAPRAVAAAGGALWVASGLDGRVRRLDLERGQVTRSVRIGVNPSAIAAAAGAVWVASEEAGTVTRVEPRTGAVVEVIAVGNGPSALATGEGAVWVVNRLDGTLSRIDPATNSVSWTLPVGRDPKAVAAGEGGVWVAGGDDGTVAHVDPDRPRVVKTITTGSSPAAITVAGGAVWTAAGVPAAAHRGGTLRALVPRGDVIGTPLDWLHPAAPGSLGMYQLTSLAYDGLVAYRRVGGAAGATLVGALATTAPPPSDDGRTYVFTLRPGLRYSDGRPLQPTDFRSSLERFLEATRDDGPAGYYVGIVGARRCLSRAGPCDLSRGIETDDRARTITVRLIARDAEFLHKLTLPFAFVVPAGSPERATTGAPPAGTGPYRIADWDADRGGTLVRNPYFGSTSARWRGEGFVDSIDVELPEGPIERRIAAVERGAADLAVIADQFESAVSAERLRALASRFPGRLHSRPAPSTDWMFLNVRRRPFDDIRVRRAVNLALDRDRIVELDGGPEVGQPTCQILPPAFPGYEPYCPYTADPTPGRGWTAPDFARAHRLVAASGRAGERVTVWAPPSKRGVGRFFSGLLNRLGLRAKLRVVEDFGVVFDPRTQAQSGFVVTTADYIAPSTFILGAFACRLAQGSATNLSALCDRQLERRIDRALRAPPEDAAAAWASVDRRITDLAAVVPMTNRRAVVLVSKRVENVIHHPQSFTLLDQLWVR